MGYTLTGVISVVLAVLMLAGQALGQNMEATASSTQTAGQDVTNPLAMPDFTPPQSTAMLAHLQEPEPEDGSGRVEQEPGNGSDWTKRS